MKRGVVLTEILVYLALFSVVLNFVYLIYYRQEEFIRRSRAYSENLDGMLFLSARFSMDVNHAGEIPSSYSGIMASEKVLLLRNGQRLVVYRYDEDAGLLLREVHDAGRISRVLNWSVSGARFAEQDGLIKAYVKPSFDGRLFEPDEFVMAAGSRNAE